jgi:hypothetical protein
MSDVIGRGVIELVADSRKLRAGVEDAKKSIRTLGEGQKDISTAASRSIDQYIGRLQAHNATIGKSARETELYRLALRGASNEQLKTADTALRLTESHERNAAALASVRTGFALLGTVAVAGSIAAAAAFDQLIHKAGNFQDLAEKIGDTASNVASLAVSASVGNISMDTLATLANKLTKNLTGVDDESSAAGAAIATLGLNIEEVKRQSPVERFLTIARALEQYAEGADKSAVATALLGKSGAEALPFLKELASGVGLQSILTDEQIKLADEYSDRQKKLSAQISLHAQAIALDLLPQLNAFKQTIADLAKDQEHAASASDVLKAALGAVINVFQTIAVLGSDVVFVFVGVGREIGAIAAQFQALQRLDFKTFNAISEAVKEDADRARKELDRFQERIMSIGTATAKTIVAGAGEEAKQETQKPKLEFIGAEAANEQIKLIDLVAKASQNAIEKGIAADLAATQARLASTGNLLASQRELERAEIQSIDRRVAAAQNAFETESKLSRARGDMGTKANVELIQSGQRLYDNLIARNNDYLNVYKTNQAQILQLDKQLADSRKSTAELVRQIDEAGFTDEQKAGSLRIRALENEGNLRNAVLTGNIEKQREFFSEGQRLAKELGDLGFVALGRNFLEDNQRLFEQGLGAQKTAAKSIAEDAKKGSEAVAEQLTNLKQELASISDNALSDVKIRADQTSLSSLVSSIRSAIEREEFKVNLQPNIAGGGVPGFARGGRASGLALVGEEGPELVRFLSPAQVYSAPDTRRMFAAMGGTLVRALAEGGIVRPEGAGRQDMVMHDIRVNGRPVAQLMGPRDQVRALVNALNADAAAIA